MMCIYSGWYLIQSLLSKILNSSYYYYRFLVLIQPLKICSNINNNQPPILGHDKLHKTISEADKKRLFSDIFQTFLSEDSESMLPLSNQALWADLQATYNALQNKTSVTNEALNQILQVRRDANIWDEGLEPSYIRFLKQTPPPTLAACILSILWFNNKQLKIAQKIYSEINVINQTCIAIFLMNKFIKIILILNFDILPEKGLESVRCEWGWLKINNQQVGWKGDLVICYMLKCTELGLWPVRL